MVGATRLLGFGPDNTVELERWKKTTKVVVPEAAIEALRKACFEELPKQPPVDEFNSTVITFDETDGSIICKMSYGHARDLHSLIIDVYGGKREWVVDLDDRSIMSKLEDALLAREAYFEPKDEPGMEGSGPEG